MEHFIIRIDISTDHNNQLFVNEVEFVPSIFTDTLYSGTTPKIKDFDVFQIIGDSIYNITKKYVNAIRNNTSIEEQELSMIKLDYLKYETFENNDSILFTTNSFIIIVLIILLVILFHYK